MWAERTPLIKTHERGAAEELDASYASLFRELTSVFRSRGVGIEEARDLAQESLVRTFVHLKRHGQTRPDLRPLAHTIAKRLYVERGRRARPQLVDLPEAEEVADPGPLPADAVVALEDQAMVHRALRTLAPRHRRVISLWMTGSRPAEIARELGIKRNAADALLHRARRQLALKLDPSRATLGLIGLVVLRVRMGLRRLADAVANVDPTGSAVQATAGIAVAGVAAVLLATQPGATPRERTEPRLFRGPVAAAHQEDLAPPTRDPSQTRGVVAADPQANRIERRLTVDPWAGEDSQGPAEAWLRYRDDGDDDSSKLAPLLDPVVVRTCRTAADLCETGR